MYSMSVERHDHCTKFVCVCAGAARRADESAAPRQPAGVLTQLGGWLRLQQPAVRAATAQPHPCRAAVHHGKCRPRHTSQC